MKLSLSLFFSLSVCLSVYPSLFCTLHSSLCHESQLISGGRDINSEHKLWKSFYMLIRWFISSEHINFVMRDFKYFLPFHSTLSHFLCLLFYSVALSHSVPVPCLPLLTLSPRCYLVSALILSPPLPTAFPSTSSLPHHNPITCSSIPPLTHD